MPGEKTYVKLYEGQTQLQNIMPGELNEAIDIDQIHGRTCEQCGQPLPSTYTPPADEEWMTGIFRCCEDTESCMTGLLCPCVLFGQNIAFMNSEIPEQQACMGHAVCIEGGITLAAITAALSGYIEPDTVCLLTEGLFFAWWVCAIYTGMGRQLLQRKYHLKDSPCDPCLVHCFLHWCAICQEHREMKRHLTERALSATAIMEPPEVQQMNTVDKHDGSSRSSREGSTEYNNLQLHPIPEHRSSSERDSLQLEPVSENPTTGERNNLQLQVAPENHSSAGWNKLEPRPDSKISSSADHNNLPVSENPSSSSEIPSSSNIGSVSENPPS